MDLQTKNLIIQDLNGFLGMNEYDEIAEFRDRIQTKIAINDKQTKFLNSVTNYFLLSGGAGAGKSLMICYKGVLMNLLYPGNRGLICRKEATSLHGSTIQTLFTQVLPASMIVNYDKQKGVVTHKTSNPNINSTIVFGGLDKRADQSYPTKIGSTEYGWIGVDEGTELELGDWQMLITRLRFKIKHFTDEENSRVPRQMFTATNPDGPTHWMYKFFFIDNKEDRDHILTNPYENPTLPDGYISGMEDSLSGLERERLLNGKWVQAEGIIYKDFDLNRHVVKPTGLLIDNFKKLAITSYKNVWFAADSNFPKPRAGLLFGSRGDGTIDVIDEFYKENSHVESLGAWITGWSKLRLNTIPGYGDPSDADAIERLNKCQGVLCEKAKNAVIPGISEVTLYFEKNKLRICDRCVNLIQELQGYKWKKKADGEVPEKENDHACFVAGTKILTLNGEKNIEDIIQGEYVLTRKGWKEVEIFSMTDDNSEVYELSFNDGRKLICTGNHPIWKQGEGWKRADSLRYSYIVVDVLRYLWNQKNLMERVTIKERMDIGEKGEDSTICTEMFGSITMDQFLKDIKSTIKITTKTIMKYQISNVYLQKDTTKNIQSKIKKKIENILKILDHLQKNGIEALKEKNGIKNIGKIVLENHLRKENIHVFNVVISLFQELHRELSSVTQIANRKICVEGVRKLKKKRKVYNLKVKDCHEYFANGILVSNCDCLRYGLFSIKITAKRRLGKAIF